MKTVVLAYSGGLDTSVCIPLLKEQYDYDRVITVVADVGQPASEIDDATKRAKTLADEHYTLDLKDEFVNTVSGETREMYDGGEKINDIGKR